MQEGTAATLRAAVRLLAGRPSDWRIRRPQVPSAPRPSLSWAGPAVAVSSILAGWWAFKDAVGKQEDVAFAFGELHPWVASCVGVW